MKKIIAMLISIILVVALGMTANADEYVSDPETRVQSTISYNVDPHFMIVIPSLIYGDQAFTFESTDMRIGDDDQVNVYCVEMASGGKITLTNAAGATAQFAFNGYNGTNLVGAFRNTQLMSLFPVTGYVENEYTLDPGEYTGTATFLIRLTTADDFSNG